MARRRKKSKAAAQAKARDKDSVMVEKSLPALPPNAIPPGAFSDERVSPDSDTPTELSPRPVRPTHPRKESSARGSPRPARSPERPQEPPRDTGLGLSAHNYRNNRHSSMLGAPADLSGITGAGTDSGDNGFFIPVALDPSPVPSVASPRSNAEAFDQRRTTNDKDYFAKKNDARGSQGSTPHIAFQEKARRSSSDYETSTPKEPSRKPSKSSRSDKSVVSQASPQGSEDRPTRPTNSKPEDFKLQDAPKSKKNTNNKPPIQPTVTAENGASTAADGPSRKESPPRSGPADRSGSPADARETRAREDDSRQPPESRRPGDADNSRPIHRKEVAAPATSRGGMYAVPALATHTDKPASLVNGRPKTEEFAAPPRPPIDQKLSDTYMSPRAPPQPPGPGARETPASATAGAKNADGEPKTSPKLPRWSSGGDFSMDEDMARILGTDEGSSSILRRVSNAVRHGRPGSTDSSLPQGRVNHGRSMSETTRATTSPRWPKTPIVTDPNGDAKDISSPISVDGAAADESAMLRRQLRNSEQRVAELERQFASEKDLLTINERLAEKRKTVSVLDTQTEIMLRELEVLAGFVERAKDTNRPIDPRVLEESTITEFISKLEKVKQSMTITIQQLHAEREELIEEKNQAIADRDRALLEFEQLSSKNAQLADMNNDLTHQIQGRFRSQVGSDGRPNGLGIYANHKAMSSTSVHNIDASSVQTGNTMVGTDIDEPILEGPTVVQVRKGQVKKFNWKKGGKTMAQNITKVGRAVAAFQTNERDPRAPPQPQQGGLSSDNIGLPYNMTTTTMEAPATTLTNGQLQNRGAPNDARSFGFFGKKQPTTNMPKSISTANIALPTAVVDASTSLFGSELVDRADYERRQIPSVVTRCIEEVELRGMDAEGIYRKSGGNSQVKMIQEGFEKMEDFDISDPSLDIASVTSVLKQYFRKLPTPLLTFDVYDRILESAGTSSPALARQMSGLARHVLTTIVDITDGEERCAHLRKTVNLLPQKHRDCLEFLMFHLARVASREQENLVRKEFPRVDYSQLLTDATDASEEPGGGICTDHHARPQSGKGDDGYACEELGCAVHARAQQRDLRHGLKRGGKVMRDSTGVLKPT